MKSLNGGKNTHTLSAHAIQELKNINEHPLPRSTVNPGVVDRLMRENLIEVAQFSSPFKVHKSANIDFLYITTEGKARLVAV